MIKVLVSDDSGYCEAVAREQIRRKFPTLDYGSDLYRIDGYQDSLANLAQEASTPSFSGEGKVFLLTDCYYLTDGKGQKDFQTPVDIQAFAAYLKHPDPVNSLFICLVGKLGKSPLAKALKASGADFEDHPLPRGEQLAMEGMKIAAELGKNIDQTSAMEVVFRVGGDFRVFRNTIEKLCLYTDAIRLPDVEALVPRPLADNVFAIADALMSDEPLKALRSYRDLRRGGLDPIGFLPVLFSQFRFMAQVSYLAGHGLGSNRIASELNCRPGRVYMNLKKLKGRTFTGLVAILADLGRMEKDIKFNLDDPDTSLENWFVSFAHRYG